ncbi:hypothetical protein ACLOJK_028016 [Asimina triloba]
MKKKKKYKSCLILKVSDLPPRGWWCLLIPNKLIHRSGHIVASPKTPAKLVHSRPTKPIYVMDIKGDTLSLERASLQAQLDATRRRGEWPPEVTVRLRAMRQDVEEEALRDQEVSSQRHVELVVTPTLVRRGVLGATLGESSSCRGDDEIFWYPFDIEVRALKILRDFLLAQSRSLKESNALGQAMSLDKEGREPTKRMLIEFLPDVW